MIVIGDGGDLNSHRTSKSFRVGGGSTHSCFNTSGKPEENDSAIVIDDQSKVMPKRLKRKKRLRQARTTVEPEEPEKPILLVTRKKSTIKKVPLDNNAYPYDLIKAKTQHLNALKNF